MAEAIPEKIDVILLTRNSLPYLMKYVDSIATNVPVNRLIAVDKGSTDGTIEFLERKFPGLLKVIQDPGNRATARQKGIEAVETRWHLHADSDVMLCKGWFEKARSHISPRIGAIWGVTIPTEPHVWHRVWAMSKLARTDPIEYQVRQSRYYTHDTLVRTEAVRGIKIPSEMAVFEDQFIGSYIVKQGFRFLRVKEPWCYHDMRDPGKRIDESILGGYFLRRYGYASFRQVVRLTPEAIPKFLWVLAWTRDFDAARALLMNQTMQLKGWLLAGPSA